MVRLLSSSVIELTARLAFSTVLLMAATLLHGHEVDSLPLTDNRGDIGASLLALPESMSMLQPSPTELRQFIGSSVIGGLMWPVLLTMALTAMVARVPDFFTRLLGGSGGLRSFEPYDPRLNLLFGGPEGSNLWEEKLEETLRIFERATSSFDGQ